MARLHRHPAISSPERRSPSRSRSPFTQAQAQQTPHRPTQLAPVVITGRAAPRPAFPAGATCRSLTPIRPACSAPSRTRGPRRPAPVADLTGFDAAISDATTHRGLLGLSLTVRGFVIDNRQLPPRRPAHQRRDLDPAGQQGAEGAQGHQRHAGRHQRARWAGELRRQAAPDASCAAPRSSGARRARHRRRRPSQRFGDGSGLRRRVNAAAAHPEGARCESGSRHLLDPWRATGASPGHAARGRDRNQPPLAAQRAWLQPARQQRAGAGRSAHQPQQPGLVTARGAGRHDRLAALAAQARRRLEIRGACGPRSSSAATASPTFGCFDPNPAPNGTYYADRYCPNGNFDLYDFRSDGERRRSDALDLNLSGRLHTGAIEHAVSAGILSSRVKNRFGLQTFAFSWHRQRRRQHHQPAGQPGAERPIRIATNARPSSACATRCASTGATRCGSVCATAPAARASATTQE